MKIALDYDKTYNLNKPFWDTFIMMSKAAGHDVHIVTARSPAKDRLTYKQIPLEVYDYLAKTNPVIYCDGIAKRWHLHHHYDLDIDVWVDDKPDNIVANSTATKEILEGWRASEDYKL